jgi:hypothetical protein
MPLKRLDSEDGKSGSRDGPGHQQGDARAPRAYQRTCGICGSPFPATHHATKYCDDVCKYEARRRQNHARWEDDPLIERNRLAIYHYKKAVATGSHDSAQRCLAETVATGGIRKDDHCTRCGRVLEKEQIQGHHVDYHRPLVVKWVCARCHTQADILRRQLEAV